MGTGGGGTSAARCRIYWKDCRWRSAERCISSEKRSSQDVVLMVAVQYNLKSRPVEKSGSGRRESGWRFKEFAESKGSTEANDDASQV